MFVGADMNWIFYMFEARHAKLVIYLNGSQSSAPPLACHGREGMGVGGLGALQL